jgi:hypothetical protein
MVFLEIKIYNNNCKKQHRMMLLFLDPDNRSREMIDYKPILEIRENLALNMIDLQYIINI